MMAPDLADLLRHAQARNRAEGITGLVVYEEGSFFQWLEGPADNLARIWDSVSRDPRHTDIEVLARQPTQARFFAEWDLRLSTRAATPGSLRPRLSELSPALIRDLYGRPNPAPMLLAGEATSGETLPGWAGGGRGPDNRARSAPTVPALIELFRSVVLPEIAARHDGSGRVAVPAPAEVVFAARLTPLLLAADPAPSAALIADRYRDAGSIAPLCGSLFEPTARHLGDLWMQDEAGEAEVILGLCRLQISLRHHATGAGRSLLRNMPSILVTPQPGEAHLLGAALDAEMLWQSGWETRAEFPRTDSALQSLVAGNWFDALDLTLSLAMRREDSLEPMARTIAAARRASCNPDLVVLVGGRAFYEDAAEGLRLGADAACGSALVIGPTALQAIRQRQ